MSPSSTGKILARSQLLKLGKKCTATKNKNNSIKYYTLLNFYEVRLTTEGYMALLGILLGLIRIQLWNNHHYQAGQRINYLTSVPSVLVWNKTTYEISSDLLASILLWLTILETMEYLSFCVWIVLFTRMLSRFMNTSTNSRIFFLQWLNKPHCLCIYACMSYFLYPFFIKRWSLKLFLHLGCSEKCWKRTWKYRYR